MKILFFFTTFRQLKENSYQFQHIRNFFHKSNFRKIHIDIFVHNNNPEYNEEMITNSIPNKKDILKINCINEFKIIYTDKNIGYSWGAQEAIFDNFESFTDYDFVIHLNTYVYIMNFNELFSGLPKSLSHILIIWLTRSMFLISF